MTFHHIQTNLYDVLMLGRFFQPTNLRPTKCVLIFAVETHDCLEFLWKLSKFINFSLKCSNQHLWLKNKFCIKCFTSLLEDAAKHLNKCQLSIESIQVCSSKLSHHLENAGRKLLQLEIPMDFLSSFRHQNKIRKNSTCK